MKYDDFVELVKKHSIENTTDFFKLTALTGEIGELANVVKKNEFYKIFELY